MILLIMNVNKIMFTAFSQPLYQQIRHLVFMKTRPQFFQTSDFSFPWWWSKLFWLRFVLLFTLSILLTRSSSLQTGSNSVSHTPIEVSRNVQMKWRRIWSLLSPFRLRVRAVAQLLMACFTLGGLERSPTAWCHGVLAELCVCVCVCPI